MLLFKAYLERGDEFISPSRVILHIREYTRQDFWTWISHFSFWASTNYTTGTSQLIRKSLCLWWIICQVGFFFLLLWFFFLGGGPQTTLLQACILAIITAHIVRIKSIFFFHNWKEKKILAQSYKFDVLVIAYKNYIYK